MVGHDEHVARRRAVLVDAGRLDNSLDGAIGCLIRSGEIVGVPRLPRGILPAGAGGVPRQSDAGGIERIGGLARFRQGELMSGAVRLLDEIATRSAAGLTSIARRPTRVW